MKLGTEIIATAQAVAQNLGVGGAGSVSARTATGMLITPSTISYSQLTPDDIVAMDFDGSWFATRELQPSAHWRLHLEIVKARSDVEAMVVTHSPYASALAAHGRGIDAVHYLVARAGGNNISCAQYATVGSPALSAAALTALEGRQACLLHHHGVVALGRSLGGALALALQVEELAKIAVLASTLGESTPIDPGEMDRVAEILRDSSDSWVKETSQVPTGI